MTRETATNYLTRKVAQILFDTVECSLPDRALSDWQQAEQIVAQGFECMIRRMIGDPIPGDVEAPEWSLGDDCTFEEFEHQLGQYVWYWTQPWRAHLPRPPYGSVTFQ